MATRSPRLPTLAAWRPTWRPTWPPAWLPSWPPSAPASWRVPAHVWPDATRMTIAAVLAFGLAELVHLHSAYWAVIASFMVTRAPGGATTRTILDRVTGTLLGLCTGVLLLEARHFHVPEMALIAAATLALGAVVATFRRYHAAPMIAIIVLSSGAAIGAAFHMAELRLTEIALGAAVGLAVSAVVLRGAARKRARQHLTGALDDLARLITLLTVRDRGAAQQGNALRERIRRELRLSAAADQRTANRRAGAGERLSAVLPRVLLDLGMLARALQEARARGHAPDPALINPLLQHAAAAVTGLSAHLQGGAPVPSLTDLDAALEQLRRELPHHDDEACMALPFLFARLFADLSAAIG